MAGPVSAKRGGRPRARGRFCGGGGARQGDISGRLWALWEGIGAPDVLKVKRIPAS